MVAHLHGEKCIQWFVCYVCSPIRTLSVHVTFFHYSLLLWLPTGYHSWMKEQTNMQENYKFTVFSKQNP